MKSGRIRPEKFDPAARLEDALAKNRVEESLRELTPDSPQYLALRQAPRNTARKQAEAGRSCP